ncbi:MAG TPA: hypothetical protein VH136_04535 [Trebonia sp.]|nr:hypothetical protein [Trebonia sp.]
MDIDAEQTDLCHYAEAHQQRIDHLRARIDRSMRELRVHETIKGLAGNSQLPYAMRGLVKMPGAEWASARAVHVFLAEYGVNVPAEWDIRVLCSLDDFTVVATNRDDWFPANLSWSLREGFNGRVTNNSPRELQRAAAAADR